MNKYKKDAWIVVWFAIPIFFLSFIGGVLAIIGTKNFWYTGFVIFGLGYAMNAFRRVERLEYESFKLNEEIKKKKQYCRENGYIFVDDKKEVKDG